MNVINLFFNSPPPTTTRGKVVATTIGVSLIITEMIILGGVTYYVLRRRNQQVIHHPAVVPPIVPAPIVPVVPPTTTPMEDIIASSRSSNDLDAQNAWWYGIGSGILALGMGTCSLSLKPQTKYSEYCFKNGACVLMGFGAIGYGILSYLSFKTTFKYRQQLNQRLQQSSSQI